LKQCLVGDKGADQTEHGFASGLLYNKWSATETDFPVWDKANDRGLRKQDRRQGFLRESLQAVAQYLEGVCAAVCIVFFSPCRAKNLSIRAASTVTL